MPDLNEYAFKPNEINKVVVIARSGKGVQTYETLLDAVTAVYRLTPVEAVGLASVLNHIEERTHES